MPLAKRRPLGTSSAGFYDPTNLKLLIRNISKSMLETQSRNQSVEIDELESKLKVYGHWMSLILVSGPAIKVTFKCHFMTRIAQTLAAAIYGGPEDVVEDQALDFVREFCNLSAGAVKKGLATQSLKSGVSIPVVTRGFDELFFPNSEMPNVFHDYWSLRTPEGSLHCSVVIELNQKIDFSNLSPTFPGGSDDQGDVEFL